MRTLLLLLSLLLTTTCYNVVNDKNPCFYLAFLKRRVGFGADTLRGDLMAAALLSANTSHRQCVNTATLFSNDFEGVQKFLATKQRGVKACVFIKQQPKHITSMTKMCNKLGAITFIDVIDYEPTLKFLRHYASHSSFYSFMNWPGSFGYSHSFLVQSQYFARLLEKAGLNAYYYPHSHSNSHSWGIKNVSQQANITVGFLVGNSQQLFNLSTVLLPAVCGAGAHFAVINQNIGSLPDKKYSCVNSTLWHFDCSQEATGKYIFSQSVHSTKVQEQGDAFQQAAFYQDAALAKIDIGLAWVRGNVRAEDLFDMQMLRPPTRLLHWLSRGVPAIYFPTHSYVDVARASKYGAGLGYDLSAYDVPSLEDKVLRLRDPKVREILHAQGLQAADQFTAQRVGSRLLDIVVEQAIKCAG
jgi:hypothetical protein